jgi:hypothetical protein
MLQPHFHPEIRRNRFRSNWFVQLSIRAGEGRLRPKDSIGKARLEIQRFLVPVTFTVVAGLVGLLFLRVPFGEKAAAYSSSTGSQASKKRDADSFNMGSCSIKNLQKVVSVLNFDPRSRVGITPYEFKGSETLGGAMFATYVCSGARQQAFTVQWVLKQNQWTLKKISRSPLR